MSKVTIVIGPQGSGKSLEIAKTVGPAQAMFVGSMSVHGLQQDPFYIQRMLLKAAELRKPFVVIEGTTNEKHLFNSMVLALLVTAVPVDVIIESNTLSAKDIPFREYVNVIECHKID
jgi:hypothetical protein